MKHTKLVDELNSQLALASEAQQSHHATLKMFFKQIEAKEQDILRKLKKKKHKADHNKLKKELGMLREAYDMLGA